MTGKVILVSAGPGGVDLMTVRGLSALRQADVVVYDRLLSHEILEQIPPAAKPIDVGKKMGNHPVPQEEINRILVQEAMNGKQVVRLKGGDSYLFGRGGEEAEALLEAQIPFEVIPGVTAALAAPACAGIPVTHRDFSSSVHIITAHAKAGKETACNYSALVQLEGTLVFLMGLQALETVVAGLLNAGASPETPAAVVENGARAGQRKVVGTLENLAQKVRAAQIKSPAVILVGSVCQLSQELDWFSERPLFGKKIVVTRPRNYAEPLVGRLRALGADVFICPCIETVENEDLSMLRKAVDMPHDWVVFTSRFGVEAAMRGLKRIGKDARALYGMQFAAIGQGTGEALASYGLTADLVPEQYDSRHLAQLLCDRMPTGGAVLLLRAEKGNQELPLRLAEAGITVTDVPLYQTVCTCAEGEWLRAQLLAGEIDYVTFTSASTVQGFVHSVGKIPADRFTALCIGDMTASAAAQYGMQIQVAKNATIDDMIAEILEGK